MIGFMEQQRKEKWGGERRNFRSVALRKMKGQYLTGKKELDLQGDRRWF